MESTRLPSMTPTTRRGAEAEALAAESAAAFCAARRVASSDPLQPPTNAAAVIRADSARVIWDMSPLPVQYPRLQARRSGSGANVGRDGRVEGQGLEPEQSLRNAARERRRGLW